jgi:hypothetical protein
MTRMARARIAGVLLAAAAFGACAAPASSPPREPPATVAPPPASPPVARPEPRPAAPVVSAAPFVLAIARTTSDGSALEPIARFTGTEWTDTWPGAEDMKAPFPPIEDIPEAWLGRPVPRDWTVWSRSGGTVRAQAIGTRRGGGCQARIQLSLERTTALDALGDASRVAADSDLPLHGFEAVDASDPDRARLEPVVRDVFLGHEPRALADDRRLMRNLPSGALAALPIVIKYLVRPIASKGTLFYFEATKGRAAIRGGAGFAISGWLRPDAAGGWSVMDVDAHGIGGASVPVPGRVPLAWFTLAGREYMLIEVFGYESLDADLVELTANGVARIVSVGRGGC